MSGFIRRKIDNWTGRLGEAALSFGKGLWTVYQEMAAMGTAPRKNREAPLFHRCNLDIRAALGPLAYVKLIHSTELAGLSRFPRYQEFQGVFLRDYYLQREAVEKAAMEIESSLRIQTRLREIDHDESVNYEWRSVSVPGSLFKRVLEIDIERGCLPQTRIVPAEGEVRDEKLVVITTLRERTVGMVLAAPSKFVHEEEITRLKAQLQRSDLAIKGLGRKWANRLNLARRA